MLMHVETLFVHDDNERLLWANRPLNPEVEPAPVVFAGLTQRGIVCRFRHDAPEDLCVGVQDVVRRSEVCDLTNYRSLVSEVKAVVQIYFDVDSVSSGPAYSFPDTISAPGECVVMDQSNYELLGREFGNYSQELELVQPCVVALEDGRAVSLCHSARQTASAAQAGVETLPEYRRQGLGVKVVAAWASLVREAGRIPLYSTSWANVASQGLAARLGLALFGADLTIWERSV